MQYYPVFRAVLTFLLGCTACGSSDAGMPSDAGVPSDGTVGNSDSGGGGADCTVPSNHVEEPTFQVTSALRGNEQCLYDVAGAKYVDGTVDVELASSYVLALGVENSLDKLVAVESVVVVRREAGQCKLAETFESNVAIGPDQSTVLLIEALVPDVLANIEIGTVALSLVVEGVSQSGEMVRSPQFKFALTVCSGCLKTDLGACVDAQGPYEIACLLGQNQQTDCCTDDTGQEVCPAQ